MLKTINLSLSLAIGLALFNIAYAENQGGLILPAEGRAANSDSGGQVGEALSNQGTETLGMVKVEFLDGDQDRYADFRYAGFHSVCTQSGIR